MLLSHRIRLDATPAQCDYFARAAGTARRVWNWAVAKWQRQITAGLRPGALALKKQVNAIKYVHPDWLDAEGRPWLRPVHRDAHAQPFAHLDKTWARYFGARKAGQPAHPPRFKKKGRCRDSSIGVDLGVSSAATLSTGEKIAAPRPLRSALRRLRIRSRRHSRKMKAAKAVAGIVGAIPKGTRLPKSANQVKGARRLARLHARIARVRAYFTHKLTTRLCRENQAVAIEDLHVKGMLANARLARSIADVGLYEIRRQRQYKARRYGTVIVLTHRWYPSSKLCSACRQKNATLTLAERVWTCTCGVRHDRDVNAAINLQRLATGARAARTALPVASPAATPGTVAGMVPAADGEFTPVRYEHGQQDSSGQEEDVAHFRARF